MTTKIKKIWENCLQIQQIYKGEKVAIDIDSNFNSNDNTQEFTVYLKKSCVKIWRTRNDSSSDEIDWTYYIDQPFVKDGFKEISIDHLINVLTSTLDDLSPRSNKNLNLLFFLKVGFYVFSILIGVGLNVLVFFSYRFIHFPLRIMILISSTFLVYFCLIRLRKIIVLPL